MERLIAVIIVGCGLVAALGKRPDSVMEAKIEETVKGYVPTGEYCSIEDLGEMNYYLFCDTQLHKGASGYEGKPSIINNNTQTIEEAKELYQKFKEQLLMEEEHYKKLSELRKKINYIGAEKINAEGDLYAGTSFDYSLLDIGKIEDGAERWNFSLQRIQEEARNTRDNMGYKENIVLGVYICQFEGNEQEGWLVVQAGPSSFFRITYPSGGVTYLGEYLYSPCFSPDGKYMAYSSVDYDNGVGMNPVEYEQTPPPGIYVREVETGKTAYMYWHPSIETGEDYMEYRDFMWVEKEAFEEYMADTVSKE